MSKKLMNLAALAILLAGSGMAMAAHPRLMAGGRCSSGDGTVSCECDGKCWADGTSCGCFGGVR